MNQYGKTSRIEIKASLSQGGQTFISDSFFTSPFKIMKPFPQEDGSIKVLLQSASPGLLAGDCQEHRLDVEKGAFIELTGQSYEKIFKMEEGEKALRKIFLTVGEKAGLIYAPLPCIPYSQSDFSSRTKISLKKNSRLIYQDILTAGRVFHGEAFDYRSYRNLVEIEREGKLIFRDNVYFSGSDGGLYPEKKEMLKSPSVFCNYTHSASLLIFGYQIEAPQIRKILGLEEKLLYTGEKPDSEKALIEASSTDSGDLVVRVLANSAEEIESHFFKIKTALRKRGG
ncbi:MAG: urease accessory protein UreD [Treponema sp.]|nr:urease accessory protein UreD [Treponema sp.]